MTTLRNNGVVVTPNGKRGTYQLSPIAEQMVPRMVSPLLFLDLRLQDNDCGMVYQCSPLQLFDLAVCRIDRSSWRVQWC